MIYAAATSLDGFVADGHGNLDWLFGHPIDPDGPGGFGEIDARAGALLMGRTTSDWVAAELARTGDRWPHRQPCWVLTSRPLDDGIPGADLHRAHGHPDEVVATLREAAGAADVWCVGGGRTATFLHDAGLLDEVWVSVAPVVLGDGTPLLGGPAVLELFDTRTNGAFAVLRYRVAGPG